MTKSIISFVVGIVAFIIIADFLFFCAWVASGQHPADEFYAGAITANVLKAVIK